MVKLYGIPVNGKIFSRRHTEIFFLENWIRHFKQIVSNQATKQELSYPVFWEK